MKSNSRLKVGVIGCGIVARNGHLPWYHHSPLAEIAAIADPDPEHLKKVGKLYKVEKQYQNPDDLLNDPSIDAVSICSPHWAHVEQAILAAKNGKHILCEKPITTNLEDIDRIIKEVEKSGVIFQSATQKRFDPGFQKIKESLEADKLGEIIHASIYWYHFVPDLEIEWIKRGLKFVKKVGIDIAKEMGAWRLTDKRSGGGDFLDHGPHYIDLFRWWFGEINNVSAHVRKFHESREFEDHAAVLFSFKDKKTTAIFERSHDFIGRFAGEELGRINGTKGRFTFSVPFEPKLKPMQLEHYSWPNIVTNKPYKVNYKFPKKHWELSYARQARSFINMVLDRSNIEVGFPKEWIPTIYDGRAALETVLAVYQSSNTQKMITL